MSVRFLGGKLTGMERGWRGSFDRNELFSQIQMLDFGAGPKHLYLNTCRSRHPKSTMTSVRKSKKFSTRHSLKQCPTIQSCMTGGSTFSANLRGMFLQPVPRRETSTKNCLISRWFFRRGRFVVAFATLSSSTRGMKSCQSSACCASGHTAWTGADTIQARGRRQSAEPKHSDSWKQCAASLPAIPGGLFRDYPQGVGSEL